MTRTVYTESEIGQFEVVARDGRVYAHITAKTQKEAESDLYAGMLGGWYERGSKVRLRTA